MRLSKKGWNNVLIFGVLIIIFLFNFSQKLMFKEPSSQHTVISKEQIIVEIKTPDFTIKRNGRNWITEPELGLSTQQLTELVSNWQNHPLQSVPAIEKPQHAFVIQIYTIDKPQPIVIQLIQQGDNYLLQRDENLALLLQGEQLGLFLGR